MPARVPHDDRLDQPRPLHLQIDEGVDDEDDDFEDEDFDAEEEDEEDDDEDAEDTERWQVRPGAGPGWFA